MAREQPIKLSAALMARVKTATSNAAQSMKEGTCEAAGFVPDMAKDTDTGNIVEWGRDKADSMTGSIRDVTLGALEKKEYVVGFVEQSGENLKQAFLDADESMKQNMEADTDIPGTTSLDRTNTPSFDQMV